MTRVSEKDFKTYKQGLEYAKSKDYENAYFNFSNVSKNSAIYEIALLRQALCADELNDSQTAIKKYRLFIEKYPDSIFIQKAYYALAQNYYKEKELNKAEKFFNDIKKNFKDTEYTKATNYYLGLIQKSRLDEEKNDKNTEEKKQKTKLFFMQYLELAPEGRFALNCIKETESLNTTLTAKEYYLIGQAYFKNGLFKSAYNNFNKSDMASSWGYLSLIYNKLGDYKKSKEIFETNYPKYAENPDKDLLHNVIENYVSLNPNGIKAGWQTVLKTAQKNRLRGEDYILYKLTKFENGDTKYNLYRQIYTKYPQGDFASDAVANLFWNAYSQNNFQEAKMLGTIHLRDYPHTNSSAQIIFWMGKLSEREGNRNEARSFFQKVIQKYPDSYYAYRASRHLSYAQNTDWKTKTTHRLPEKNSLIEFPYEQAQISDDNLSLLNTILKLNDYKLLLETSGENQAIQSWISYKEQKFATSALQAREYIANKEIKPDFSEPIYKLAYQLHYQDKINYYAKLYNLDSYLIAALIREESYFNKNAGSSVGAIGLMQLMPSTAIYISGKKSIPYNGLSSLYNPAININLGCAYLSDAKKSLHNNDMLAVASYNGGPNAVKTWKSSLNYRNFDEFIENIPYAETKDYVKKVYRSYWVYLNVY